MSSDVQGVGWNRSILKGIQAGAIVGSHWQFHGNYRGLNQRGLRGEELR